jgi:carboxyl-terminal processing protease
MRGARGVVLLGTILTALLLAACSDEAKEEAPVPAAASVSTEVEAGSSGPFMAEIMEPEEPLVAPSEVPEELKTIWEVWALLTREHVDRAGLDPKAVTEAAIRGMLLPLEDPQTAYVSAEYLTQSTQDLGGSFEGIGATVQMRLDGKLIIVAPIEGGPAEAAGLLSGDVILEVDGKDLEGLSLLEAVSQIRGRRGTTVVLLVLHLGEIEPAEISIVRDKIPLESVLLRSEPGDTIAHIRLTDFYGDTAEKLRSKINEAIASGAKALIIDVRDNPGGLLNAAIDVTSQFLEEGLVLYEEDGAGRRTNFRVREGGVATDIPMVVLANAGSASASEILAGAMQDHKRALVIGSTTFGKGTVNTFRRLGNGAGLYMSIARYYTPAGRSIEDVGVIPDIEVTSRDRQIAETDQLNKAIEILEAEIARLSRVPG